MTFGVSAFPIDNFNDDGPHRDGFETFRGGPEAGDNIRGHGKDDHVERFLFDVAAGWGSPFGYAAPADAECGFPGCGGVFFNAFDAAPRAEFAVGAFGDFGEEGGLEVPDAAADGDVAGAEGGAAVIYDVDGREGGDGGGIGRRHGGDEGEEVVGCKGFGEADARGVGDEGFIFAGCRDEAGDDGEAEEDEKERKVEVGEEHEEEFGEELADSAEAGDGGEGEGGAERAQVGGEFHARWEAECVALRRCRDLQAPQQVGEVGIIAQGERAHGYVDDVGGTAGVRD